MYVPGFSYFDPLAVKHRKYEGATLFFFCKDTLYNRAFCQQEATPSNREPCTGIERNASTCDSASSTSKSRCKHRRDRGLPTSRLNSSTKVLAPNISFSKEYASTPGGGGGERSQEVRTSTVSGRTETRKVLSLALRNARCPAEFMYKSPITVASM